MKKFSHLFTTIASSFIVISTSVLAQAPLVSIPSQDAFFDKIKLLCGKSFLGKVVVDNAPPSSFSTSKLVMHKMY